MAGVLTISEICTDRGNLILGSCGEFLSLCIWENTACKQQILKRLQRLLDVDIISGTTPVIDMASIQLKEYFQGKRIAFDIPVICSGTDFQKRVWDYLTHIKYGNCESYSRVAKNIGTPKSVRAVANACKANALHIIIQCHRVVSCNGGLSGYAGGINNKKLLLDIEETRIIHDDKVRHE